MPAVALNINNFLYRVAMQQDYKVIKTAFHFSTFFFDHVAVLAPDMISLPCGLCVVSLHGTASFF